MKKQEYLERLSKMNGNHLVEELLYRQYLLEQEENTNGYTEKYFDLKHMYNTCSDYIVEKLDK